jgi:excisionase family DNA binding protein
MKNYNTVLLKVKDVASILGISQSSAYRLMQTVIPTVRFGRTVRVRSEDLARFIELNLSIASQEGREILRNNGCNLDSFYQDQQQPEWSK